MNMQEVIVSSHVLTRLCVDKLMKHGVAEDQASIIADVLVHANLRGVDSHGVSRMEHYIKRVQSGGINPKPSIRMKQTGPCTAVVDGDDGFGHVIAKQAMDYAIELAELNGVGVIGIINSSHCGALSYFVNQAAERNMIGMMMANTDKFVAPFGAAEPYFGTNPIAFGFPAGRQNPIILDMATSQAAVGKILSAKQAGKSIPADWAVDRDGMPTTDPDQVAALNPAGGPKGTSLALAVDMFAGILTGSAYGPYVSEMYANYDSPRKLGHFLMAIRTGCFTDESSFADAADRLIGDIHNLRPAANFDAVLAPGEPEQLKERERAAKGIPVPESIYSFLQA